MTASRADAAARGGRYRPLPGLLLAGLLGTLADSVLNAQTMPPPPLTPPLTPSAVERQPIAAVSGEAAGIAIDDVFPADLWRNTPRLRVEAALPVLPVAARSLTMRSLERRLLLSAAVPPPGPAGSSLLDLRAMLLWRMGDVAGLRRLIDALPVRERTGTIARLDAELRLLAGDATTACDIAAVEVGREGTPFWQQALVFCQARAGDRAGAALGLDLLREQGAEDSTLATLVRAMGGEKVALPSLAEATPLQLAAAQAANVALPADLGGRAALPVLAAIARLPNAPAVARLKAADRAAAADAIVPEVVREIYAQAVPTTNGTDDSAEVRAARYREAVALVVPEARAGALARALGEARAQGRSTAALRLYEPMLRALKPSPELMLYAGEIVPALLVAGDRAAAEDWLRTAADEAGTNEDAARAIVQLLPAAAIANLPAVAVANGEALAAWSKSIQRNPGGTEAVARLFALLDALGDPAPDPLVAELLTGPRSVSAQVPLATLLAVMRRAAADRRLGETVLMSLIALGEPGPAGSDATTLALVVEALRSVGLETDARALALEGVVR